MSTDRELLEMAAKAAGMSCSWAHEDEADYSASTDGMWLNGARGPDNSKFWNPLTDDGDALRLAVKLHLEITIEPEEVWAGHYAKEFPEGFITGSDSYAATRRAIVRAAAEIGKAMP